MIVGLFSDFPIAVDFSIDCPPINVNTADLKGFKTSSININFEQTVNNAGDRWGTRWKFPVDQVKELELSTTSGRQKAPELKVFQSLDREDLLVRNERSILLDRLAFADVSKAMESEKTLAERTVQHSKTVDDENLLDQLEANISALSYAKSIIDRKLYGRPPSDLSKEINDFSREVSSTLKKTDEMRNDALSLEVSAIKSNIDPLTRKMASLSIEKQKKKHPRQKLLDLLEPPKVKAYTVSWTMHLSDLILQERDDFEKAYNDFGAKERNVSSQRDSILYKMAIIQLAPVKDKSLVEKQVQLWRQVEPLVKRLEGEGGAFRYAQYFILKKYILTHPPLDRKPAQWYPTEKGMIQYFVESRKIQHLVHFTQAANLKSIMKHGLLSVDTIDKRNETETQQIIALKNDLQRLDKCPDGTSFSLSFPNDVFFYRRRVSGENQGKAWAVLLLKPSVLWEKNCVFNHHNGASKELSEKTPEERSTLRAFQSMFEDVSGPNSRNNAKLELFDTTNTQAEIFVRDSISSDYITEIKFETEEDEKIYGPFLEDTQVSVDPDVFGQREWLRR